MTTPLSLALRETTSAAHASAENSSFIAELMQGSACPRAYTALVVQNLVIYRALEDVLADHYADHPMLAGVSDPRLARVAAIERDLTALVGPDFAVRLAAGTLPICPATVAYATVIRERHSPEFMLANHYVRYLGDLSGGQIIARLVQRHYGVSDDALHFYRFEGIDKPKPYKDAYRAALDATPLTEVERERTLAAAVWAFGLNEAVFADLGAARAPLHAAAGLSA